MCFAGDIARVHSHTLHYRRHKELCRVTPCFAARRSSSRRTIHDTQSKAEIAEFENHVKKIPNHAQGGAGAGGQGPLGRLGITTNHRPYRDRFAPPISRVEAARGPAPPCSPKPTPTLVRRKAPSAACVPSLDRDRAGGRANRVAVNTRCPPHTKSTSTINAR